MGGHPSKGKQTKTCLKVNEIDFTTRRALQKNKFASRSPKSTSPTRAPIKREANKNVSQGQRNRLYHKKSTAKNKFASRSPKSTSPTRAPIKRKANKKIKRRARELKDKRPFYISTNKKKPPYSH